MKPFLERVQRPPGASWAWLDRKLDNGIPFQWHHHPEFELTLTLNSRGQRFIGDHIGEYGDGDLVLIGPNLPHTWVSRDRIAEGPHVAQVMWFHPDWTAALGGKQNFSFSRNQSWKTSITIGMNKLSTNVATIVTSGIENEQVSLPGFMVPPDGIPEPCSN